MATRDRSGCTSEGLQFFVAEPYTIAADGCVLPSMGRRQHPERPRVYRSISTTLLPTRSLRNFFVGNREWKPQVHGEVLRQVRTRKYEFIYIVDPSLDESAANQSLDTYCKLVEAQEGEVTHRSIWARRKFAYEIKKKTEGTYLMIRMTMPPEGLAEINRALHYDENVLRHLIVIDEEWERRNAEARQQQAQKQATRAARETRGGEVGQA